MKAVVLQQPGRFAIREAPSPEPPAPGEALVRVHQVGICGTDIHAYAGRQPFFVYPRIIGHELGVEVAAVGAGVENVRVGDCCAVEPYLECGTCIACRRGRPNCCVNMRVIGVHIDGGMRPYLVLPARKLHPGAGLSFEQLALVETLGIGAHAVSRARPEAGEVVLVIGAGPIGVSAVQFAQLAGAKVIVLDVDPHRLRFCRDRLGVEHILEASEETAGHLQELAGGDLPTAVIDATGNQHSMARAFGYAAHGGRLVFVGLFQGDITFNDPEFHRRELTLLASRNAASEDFGRIIAHVQAGRLDTRPWITHRTSWDGLPDALPLWLEPDAYLLKGMVGF